MTRFSRKRRAMLGGAVGVGLDSVGAVRATARGRFVLIVGVEPWVEGIGVGVVG